MDLEDNIDPIDDLLDKLNDKKNNKKTTYPKDLINLPNLLKK